MLHVADMYLFPGVFAPPLSLEVLTAQLDVEGFSNFDIPDEAPQPDERIERSEACLAVGNFLSNLKSRDREIVIRMFWMDHSQAEIAESFGISRMAINKAVARIYKDGRKTLAAFQ